MGILCPVILPATCVVPPRNTKFAQRRAVGSELVSHDGGWRDALRLQEFSHQLERRLAVSPWLNEDVQDLAFAVHGTPDVQLSAVDGDEHFVEMPPPVRLTPLGASLAPIVQAMERWTLRNNLASPSIKSKRQGAVR